MKWKLPGILIFFVGMFVSCDSGVTNKTHPVHQFRDVTDSVKTELQGADAKADEYFLDTVLASENDKPIIGCWFFPHNAHLKIKFLNDGRFEFKDYNTKISEWELLIGSYELKNETLTLIYDDRPKQRFTFTKDSVVADLYYIKNNSGYYFVKGICQ